MENKSALYIFRKLFYRRKGRPGLVITRVGCHNVNNSSKKWRLSSLCVIYIVHYQNDSNNFYLEKQPIV